jgi:hypothetical protein
MDILKQIVNGPDKKCLILSLSEGKEISFHSEMGINSVVKRIKITGLEKEDNLENEWLVRGFNVETKESFTGSYSSEIKKGKFIFIKKLFKIKKKVFMIN